MRLTIRRYLLIASLAVIFTTGALATTTASAKKPSGSAVVADCISHLKLTRTYSIPELQTALQSLSADVQEYSNCQDVINRALLAAEGKLHGNDSGSGTSSSGSSGLPTPLIVVLVLLALAAVTLAALAIRRRRA